MKRLLLVFFVAAYFFSANAHAQEIHLETPIRLHPINERTASEAALNGPDEFPIIHVTDDLMRSPEGQRALKKYQRMLQSSQLYANQIAQPEEGDSATFTVFSYIDGYEDKEFVLKAKKARFNLWVAVTALDSNYVRPQDIDSMVVALGQRTPEESFNPNRGILDNDEKVFGQPPDVDGNGRATILWFNIEDGWTPPPPRQGYIAGYVAPRVNTLNTADIMTLDVLPGVYVPEDLDFPTQAGRYADVSNILATAAHEYQHLIMLAYDYDTDELSFVNEGLSEYAEIVNGYPIRTPSYLTDPVRYNVQLFRFVDSGNQLFDDYQRAGAFHNYFGDQIGVLETGVLTRLPADGEAAYNEALDRAGVSRDFDAIVFDFHTANLVQDTTLNRRFGYTTRGRANNAAVPKVVYDGRLSSSTALTADTLRAGGALFYRWEQVEDFQIMVDPINESLRARLHLRAIVEDSSGAVSFRGFEPGNEPEVFSGAFQKISLIAVDVAAGAFPDEVPFEYEASWTPPGVEYESNLVVYDNGQATTYLGIANSDTSAQIVATKFDVPFNDGIVRLDKVFLPLYFISYFGQAPESAPRDFVLKIWDVGADGEPGNLIFDQAYVDTRPHFSVFTNDPIKFFEVDLASFSDDLSNLPDSIYVGFQGVGPDDNFAATAVASYDSMNVSQFLFDGDNDGDMEWYDWWNLSTSTTSFDSTVIPIRAQFLYPTNVDVEQTPTLPTRITLHQNYPNPFTTSTTIEYTLPHPAEVRLEVYDVLGRRVATLVDERLAAGTYEVPVNMSGRASGLYIYRLKAGDRILTRKMLHIK